MSDPCTNALRAKRGRLLEERWELQAHVVRLRAQGAPPEQVNATESLLARLEGELAGIECELERWD